MAALDFLPRTIYRAPSPVQAHQRRRSLNTIIEDDEESSRGSYVGKNAQVRSPQKADWRSPLSDHFPTPRGKHFLTAPLIPTSPSGSETSSSCPPSEPWTRSSLSTEDTDFDDLYDVSSDDERKRKSTHVRSKRTSVLSTTASRRSLPALQIPVIAEEHQWAQVHAFKALTSPKAFTSPIPQSPPLKVPHSPAIFSILQQSQDVPSISAPPSLDGSLSSDQLAQLSAPPTPDIGYESDDEARNGWGFQLQPAAMATLQTLSGDDFSTLGQESGDQVLELSEVSGESSMREMQEVSRFPSLNTAFRRSNSVALSPNQQQSSSSLTKLDIPSPGGFYGSLSRTARQSWQPVPVPSTPKTAVPPSSTTAENFYNTPWTSVLAERIIEVPDRDGTDGPPTAVSCRPELQRRDSSCETITGDLAPLKSPKSQEEIKQTLEEELIPEELVQSRNVIVSPVDRTAMWLAAQHDYLSELINPKEARDDEAALLQRAASVKNLPRLPATSSEDVPVLPPRKSVQFSEQPVEVCPIPKTAQESTYFRAFQQFMERTRGSDAFSHRIPRFEAIQSQRVTFPVEHRNQLLGKFQLSVQPSSPHRRMSANVVRGDELTSGDPVKIKQEKSREALEQMSSAAWNITATKLLNGGRLINAPVAKRLARLSVVGPKANGMPRDALRILDLGGQSTCDWAWQCASEYPHCKIYTVTTKALRQLSNSNIRGPSNHRQVSVERLTKLPFKDNHFDLISAREIYSNLKESGENGVNEWDACLAECNRILKPGGYLDFTMMDCDIVNAGPLANARSVEFGFNLKTLGYDPTPTKQWLARLKGNGFVGIKRAWVFLPMGASIEAKDALSYRDSLGKEVPLAMQAMVSGTTDGAASITGLVGGWAWEKWMLRCRVLTVGSEGTLDGIMDIFEEGRKGNAGWRTLSGWARKPLSG